MLSVARSFEKYRGRPPERAELLRLLRIQEALQLRDDDALWAFVMLFDEYQSSASDLPERIREAASRAVAVTEQAARAQVAVAVAGAQEEALRAMKGAVKKAVNAVTWTQSFVWAMFFLVVVAVNMVVGGFYLQRISYEAGVRDATEVADESNAAAKWARTEQGRRAYAYAASGQLDRWMYCTHPGFKVEGKLCFPAELNNGAKLGWPVDPGPPRKRRKPN
ncbi:hypothetical protein CHU93_16755 [Sandarakinorhabdus cyanobacteriorum]|uniref:Uncharacterized protein n=1 Tax=Sandarakinorhabdus cyanobacteriorum TaxID=1981098 RepID=A0A255Y649_9SPHN|nr:hypothetical protein [Sandarakinorhabdus cyanobacteriorum]OYQ23900.1 hypothetical protein CHU93_16755 [Sandarakinorhabdus cyanobacteriorum]